MRPDTKDERSRVRRRVLLRLAGSPWVLAPTLLGFSAAISSWALDLKQVGLALFAGLSGVLIGAGIFASKWLLSAPSTAQAILNEMEAEQRIRRKQELDQLEKVLEQSDRDPRPEAALRDLRALVDTFAGMEKHASGAQWAVLMDVRLQVEALFAHSVRLIEQTHQLWSTAERLSTPAARQPVLDQRETIIFDIQASVKQLSHSLVSIQGLGSIQGASQELQQVRSDLDASLEIARKVEARMRDWATETNAMKAEPF